MSSSNPYSFPPSFVDLLSSQQEGTIPVNNPSSAPLHFCSQPVQTIYDSQPSSAPPQFCSQPVQRTPLTHPSQTSFTTTEFPTVGDISPLDSREGRKRWSPSEDVLLISAWLNTSKDPVVGNEQKADHFWKRIAAYFAASHGGATKGSRGEIQCKQRWRKINEGVNKFVGCFSQATSRRKSGQCGDDVMKLAHELYLNDHKVKFGLEHCWRELRHDQKWCSTQQCKGQEASKRSKLDVDGAYSSSSNTEPSERPPGVKASKRKGKKPVVSDGAEEDSLLKLERLWTIKEKELEGKDRIANKRLLDSLIAKSELTDSELVLKDKLIDEILTKF